MGGNRKKIIFVDDVNYTLITVKDKLKEYYEVYPAQSVEIMFEILERMKPDMILLDVNMPDVGGYEAIKQLKANEKYSDIPVMFLTGQSGKESVVEGLSLGAVDYVTKPFSSALLIERIEFQLNPESREKVSKLDDEDTSKPAVLAVDDVSSMLMAIRFALRDKYRVFMLSNSEEVEDFLRKKTPDLIILDYNMPGRDGFELIPVIRSFPEHKDTPIIFLTSEGTVDHISVALHLGAADFIVKPIDTRALREKVAKHIKK